MNQIPAKRFNEWVLAVLQGRADTSLREGVKCDHPGIYGDRVEIPAPVVKLMIESDDAEWHRLTHTNMKGNRNADHR